MMDVDTSIQIAAAPETIWRVISNFEEWKLWHRTPVEISILRGKPITLSFFRHNKKIKLALSNVEILEGEYIQWVGHFPFFRYVLNGCRRFSIESISEKSSILRQQEHFGGLLSPLFRKRLVKTYSDNYNYLNSRVKEIAEAD